MKGKYSCIVAEEELWLLPDRAIYWPTQKTLLIADAHLGKSSHFRKAGLAVPATVAHADIDRIKKLVHITGSERVIFLGDLFHSDVNTEWLLFEELISYCSTCEFVLIKGNHDILPETIYSGSSLKIVDQELSIYPFLLTHHPPAPANTRTTYYTLCGHIHPGVSLVGKGGLQQNMACFYFGLHYGILPAFGKFTGFHKLKPKSADAVFGLIPGKVVALQIPEQGVLTSLM